MYLACRKLLAFDFSHTHSYLKALILLQIKILVNGCEAVITIAPLGLITRFNCSHIGSKGIIESHLQAVVPYGHGGSVRTISTDASGICDISTRQSPL
jgi:hypothetical protein